MGMKNKPYWFNILKHFERKGYVYNGLTIPYLIGARSIVVPNSIKWSIPDFITSLSEYGCTIMWCDFVGEFVIGPLENLEYTPKCLNDTFGKIIAIDDALNSIHSIEELIIFFEKEYHAKIENGKYSKNYGIWEYFSETDEKRLNEVIETILH